jgi:hypothetical protein
MARGGKTTVRNRSSVVSRRTAVPDAIVNFCCSSSRCDCGAWTVICVSIFVRVCVLRGSLSFSEVS